MRSKDLCGVILMSVNKTKIYRHKVILASANRVFRYIFKSVDNITPLVYMRNSKAQLVNSIVELICFGETNVNQAEGGQRHRSDCKHWSQRSLSKADECQFLQTSRKLYQKQKQKLQE